MITIGFSTKEINNGYINHLRNSCGIKNVEIIPFENKGTHSLTEAYNIILEQSTNDIVVLCHDDIKLKTKKWGSKIIEHFNNSDYGIIGVAGTTYYPESGMWWEDKHSMVGCVNHKHPETNKEYTSKYSALVDDGIIPVVSLDGVFMVVNKKRIKYDFDENVKGFHFYDVDFTLGNHLKGVKVGCITNIRVLHYSIGQTNQEWENNRIKFAEKWKDHLPLTHEETKIFYKQNTVKLKKEPKISIIILSKSANKLLFNCIDSILEKTKYSNYEIIVGDTGSSEDEIDEFNEKYSQENINLIDIGNYHFATNNNDIVENYVSKDSELVLFCNNDIELINDSISHMVSVYNNNKHNVGTIGARLHYEDNTIQHSGMLSVFETKKSKLHITHVGIKTKYSYVDGNQPVIGNTAAFLLMNKNLFINIGMFPTHYEECFEDVHLNIKTNDKNKVNIFVGDAVLYHYESQTRDLDSQENKLTRLNRDYQKLLIELKKSTKSSKYIKTI